jgi:hypothetical protein
MGKKRTNSVINNENDIYFYNNDSNDIDNDILMKQEINEIDEEVKTEKKQCIFGKISNYSQYIIHLFSIPINLFGIYLMWIIFHYSASHIYIIYCVPKTWVGFFVSPLLTSTPHCQGLRWIIYNGGNQINNMWISIGTWICIKLLS